MDFGVLGVDSFVGPENNSNNNNNNNNNGGGAQQISAPEAKQKCLGSVLAKQERSSVPGQDVDWRLSKMQRTDDFSVPKTMTLHHGSPLLRSNSLVSSDEQEHLLGFSSLKTETSPFLINKDCSLEEKRAQNNPVFPYYQNTSSSAHTRGSGYGTGSLNGSMHRAFTGVRGPFTPSQWMELEHQALIYKYITTNVPVPSNLLNPLKKSLFSYGFSGSSAASFPPGSLGWSTFHLGFAGNTTDPEPGRCRRTDGKKWRCSRDAVADQKYCERHINRGRHRSRKPVEGQTGHAATGPTNSKVAPMTTSMSTSVITSGGTSNSLAITQHQFKNLQPAATASSTDALVNRFSLSKGNVNRQDTPSVSMMSSSIHMKSKESAFRIPKQDIPTEESSQSEFGLVSADSLLNPSQRCSYMNSKNYESFMNFGDQETQDQHPLLQFMDDWPKDQSRSSIISWPEELKSDWTQLSMSIAVASSDFSSSSSSPMQEKHALSPLRLSREFDAIQMGLGVSSDLADSTQKQTNWVPISWGASMGGPLGEVLTTSTSNIGTCKSSSALNLLTEGWDGSPQFRSSPTGVLQKATFGSLSNSSSGSSPRAESKKNNNGVAVCEDVLGSTIVSSSPIPSL